MSSSLNECPFCGSKVYIVGPPLFQLKGVRCNNSACRTFWVYPDTYTDEQIIEAWNRRFEK